MILRWRKWWWHFEFSFSMTKTSPYISHFRSSYRTNDQFALYGEKLILSILKISPHEKSKKFPPKERRIVLSSPETGAALF